MDYGQFYLFGGARMLPPGADTPSVEEADDEWQQVLDSAYASQTIAGDGYNLVVISPHQNNFDMHITVEVWEESQPQDLDAWQYVVYGDLEIGEKGELTFESPTMPPTPAVQVAPGNYRAEISGRGFVSPGWPGSTTPGDAWRVRLWPDALDLLPVPSPKRWP